MELFRQQKQIEERQVKLALAGMGLELHAAHVRREESPDFILPLGGRRIGIEHTEFFFPEKETSAPRGFQNLRHEAVEMARLKFRANGGPPLYVTPEFIDIPHPMGPNTRSCRDDFAERFERVVRANGWPDDPHDHRVFNFHPDLPEIAYYMVSPSIDGTDELWACGGAAIERYVEPHHIQAVLDKKAEKHQSYSQKCDSVWLLIVNGGAIRTVPCELGDYARDASYSSPFDRAFWLDRFPSRDLVRLRL